MKIFRFDVGFENITIIFFQFFEFDNINKPKWFVFLQYQQTNWYLNDSISVSVDTHVSGQLQDTHFNNSFNRHAFQVLLWHTFDTRISGTISTHTHTHTDTFQHGASLDYANQYSTTINFHNSKNHLARKLMIPESRFTYINIKGVLYRPSSEWVFGKNSHI